jgi:hypothetical protein
MMNQTLIWTAVALAVAALGIWKPKALGAILLIALVVVVGLSVFCVIGFAGMLILSALAGSLKKK